MKSKTKRQAAERVIDGLLCLAAIAGLIVLTCVVAQRVIYNASAEAGPVETRTVVARVSPPPVTVAATEAPTDGEEEPTGEETPEQSYSDEELAILANTVYHEAGGCSDRMQQLVAAVVLNRVADPRYADTIHGVVAQRGQYGPGNYIYDLPDEATAGAEMQRCFANARAALDGGVECPENVIFQAEFGQGSGTYEALTAPWGTTLYFCYG